MVRAAEGEPGPVTVAATVGKRDHVMGFDSIEGRGAAIDGAGSTGRSKHAASEVASTAS